MEYVIAVIGATGNVGREMLNILHERDFPAKKVIAIGSSRSVGTEVFYGDMVLKCQSLENTDFKEVDFVLMSAGSEISKLWARKIAEQGVIVIDNASYFRMHQDVPLIVPEVNAHVLEEYMKKDNRLNIVANPNCSTAQLVVALKPLHDEAKINRIVVATYQSVSGAGKVATDELFEQTRSVYMNNTKKSKFFTKQIAFNVIPHIDSFIEGGDTKEEWKIEVETKKILDKNIKVTSTAVRVPVFVGHAEAVNISFDHPISAKKASDILRSAPGCMLVDKVEDNQYITPIECVGEYATYISRVREDKTVEHGLNLWIVSDNLRKGASLNTVQIAETIVNRRLLIPKNMSEM